MTHTEISIIDAEDLQWRYRTMSERNTYPNTYIVRYTDYMGNEHTKEIDALTADEAKVRLIAELPAGAIRDMTARPKPITEKRLYKISDLWG